MNMLTKAQEQAERFRNTQCPAPWSRKKIKAIAPHRKYLTGEVVAKMLGRHDQWKARVESMQKRIPWQTPDNRLEVFQDMLKDLGGEFHPVVNNDEKKITGRRADALAQREVEMVSESKALRAEALYDAGDDKVQGTYKRAYYRDDDGSLRRTVVKK